MFVSIPNTFFRAGCTRVTIKCKKHCSMHLFGVLIENAFFTIYILTMYTFYMMFNTHVFTIYMYVLKMYTFYMFNTHFSQYIYSKCTHFI